MEGERGTVWTYRCPMCDEEYYLHTYFTPTVGDYVICHCDHSLAIDGVDMDNKTIDCHAVKFVNVENPTEDCHG